MFNDCKGDMDVLREDELWLFADKAWRPDGGAPNAGTASDAGCVMKRWRRIAGLEDSKE
ncbi:hypothetical protein SAMN04487824_10392 [Parafannyhessea umbonata]|uniref:Uncharacterized protein n=1 Tax=Parafannyhessea umbonata TaxID=604330 RepID=A0A1G6IWM5_9ACTN|nr:hypothetical protein SAMN04487824_10392 [Parafannyhessea umbonata]